MKRMIAFFFISCFICLSGCQSQMANETSQKETYVLVINGNPAGQIDYDTKDNLAELPLVRILQCLGAEIDWRDDTTAHILYQGKEMILDLNKGSLKVEKNGFASDLLLPAPGATTVHMYELDRELIVDELTLFLFFDEFNIKQKFDQPNKTIFITTAD